MGLLNRLFGEGDGEDEEESIEEILIKFHTEIVPYTQTMVDTVERTVTMYHFGDDNPIIVAHDSIDNDDGKHFRVSGFRRERNYGSYRTSQRGKEDRTVTPAFEDFVTQITTDAVTHREVLGQYDVKVIQDVKFKEIYDQVDNPEDLVFDTNDNVAHRSPGHRLVTETGDTISKVVPDGSDGYRTIGGTKPVEFLDASIEPQSSVFEQVNSTIIGQTDSVQVIGDDGRMLVPPDAMTIGEEEGVLGDWAAIAELEPADDE